MDKVTRERSANFSLNERDILVSLVYKYRTVIENKKSDASTWKKKEATWERIQSEFNTRSGGTFRSTKTLKIKYEGLKRTVRKKSAALRSEPYLTGGGKNAAPPLDDAEEQIKSMITLNTNGLESVHDSDVQPETQESEDSFDAFKEEGLEESMEVPMLNTDYRIAEVLQCNATYNQVLLLVKNECKPLPPKATNTNIDYVKDNEPRKTSLDELTQARLELVQLQKAFLEAELIEKKKVWEFEENERKKESEFKDKERKWKEEEYKLKLGKNLI